MAFEILFLVGRIIVGAYFLMGSYNHFSKHKMMVGYSNSKGVPMPEVAVPLTGIILLLGGISLLLGIYPLIGITLILIFLIPTTFIMHRFWEDPEEHKMENMINFFKNLALIGLTLMLLAIPTPWPFSVLG